MERSNRIIQDWGTFRGRLSAMCSAEGLVQRRAAAVVQQPHTFFLQSSASPARCIPPLNFHPLLHILHGHSITSFVLCSILFGSSSSSSQPPSLHLCARRPSGKSAAQNFLVKFSCKLNLSLFPHERKYR